jgi:acyl dehydratase
MMQATDKEARGMADRSGAKTPLYLDDLQVGQRFTSDSHVLDEAQIKEFAAQFDPQPFHLDNEAAKATMFGGLAASGWHTAAITMRLLVQSGLPIAGGIIGSGGEISWPKPTRPGDTLTVVSEIEEVTPSRSRPDRGTIRVRSETRNQHGDVVQTLRPRLVVPRRPVPSTGAQDAKTAAPVFIKS